MLPPGTVIVAVVVEPAEAIMPEPTVVPNEGDPLAGMLDANSMDVAERGNRGAGQRELLGGWIVGFRRDADGGRSSTTDDDEAQIIPRDRVLARISTRINLDVKRIQIGDIQSRRSSLLAIGRVIVTQKICQHMVAGDLPVPGVLIEIAVNIMQIHEGPA